MEFEALLEARRSVRAFDATKTVTEDQIKTLIEAGIQAPSWKNSQTARYYCILSDDIKEKFAADCLPEFLIIMLCLSLKPACIIMLYFINIISNRVHFFNNTITVYTSSGIIKAYNSTIHIPDYK